MDLFFYLSGVVAWGALGLLGIVALSDYVMDIFIGWFWTKREFLAFVADRLKKRTPKIPGG